MKYVFDTQDNKRYEFPTHKNDLVIDRADAATSEVFVVIVEPGKATHTHTHDDLEQIFYVVEGKGMLIIGRSKEEYPIEPTQVVKIPPSTRHSVRTVGTKALRYVCIDCFCPNRKNNEPTWEAHVKVLCRQQGYDFNDVAHAAQQRARKKKQ
jgi:mannose-6-phosphate isomerase-like protein (cupin superfamily)